MVTMQNYNTFDRRSIGTKVEEIEKWQPNSKDTYTVIESHQQKVVKKTCIQKLQI